MNKAQSYLDEAMAKYKTQQEVLAYLAGIQAGIERAQQIWREE